MKRALIHLIQRSAPVKIPLITVFVISCSALALTCGFLGILLIGALPLGICASAMSIILAIFFFRVFRTEKKLKPIDITKYGVIAGAVAGFLNAFLCYFVLCAALLLIPFGKSPLMQFGIVLMGALFVGMPLGTIFGWIYSIPLRKTYFLRVLSPPRSTACLLRMCGLWLILISVCSLLLGSIEVWIWHFGHLERAWPLLIGCAPALIAGIVLLTLSKKDRLEKLALTFKKLEEYNEEKLRNRPELGPHMIDGNKNSPKWLLFALFRKS